MRRRPAMNHLVKANKKVSKTPRTDIQPVVIVGFNKFVKAGFARQLERQLAEANKRIKELELEIKARKVRSIEDGKRIFELGTRLDRYRMTLMKAFERVNKVEGR
jgi:hypothetical protein